MGVTSRGWRTPETTDAPDVVTYVKNLAADANADLAEVDSRTKAGIEELRLGQTVATDAATRAAASAAKAEGDAATAVGLLVDAQAPTDAFVAGVFNNPASQVRQTAGKLYAAAKASTRGNLAVFLGDSITAFGDIPSGGNTGPGYAWYAAVTTGQRLRYVYNAGIPGNTSAQMLARFDADVAAKKPSLVHILAGTNDWNDASTTTLAEYAANITAIVEKVRLLGARPVLGTIPPNIISTTRRQRTITGNAWLRQFAQAQGIDLIDYYALLVDPATGGMAAAWNLDGTHPNNPGLQKMGKYLAEQISPSLPPTESLLPQENADPNNLLTNGLNLTTTGAGASLMPTGWTVQTAHPAGASGALVADAAIKGNWWKITADGTLASTNNEFQNVTGAKVIPGHRYACVGRVKATGLRNADTGNGSGYLLGMAFNSKLLDPAYDFRFPTTLYYDTPGGIFYREATAPADTTAILVRRQITATAGGAGELWVAQMGLYDLTAMGLA